MTGKKLTPKQERFAQCVAQGMSYSASYREAYDAEGMLQKSIWEKSSELMANVKVSSRVMELQEMAQERTLVTIETVTEELNEAADIARTKMDASALKGAVAEKARLHGLYEKDNKQRGLGGLTEWLSERGES